MKFIKAKSYNELFVKCIISSIILNVCVFLISIHVSDLTYILLEYAQICFNLFWGLLIRKTNRNLFSTPKMRRKKYAIITLTGLVFLFIIICEPDIIAVPYTYVIVIIYKATGLDRLLTVFDYASILICLGAVFFYTPKKHLETTHLKLKTDM